METEKIENKAENFDGEKKEVKQEMAGVPFDGDKNESSYDEFLGLSKKKDTQAASASRSVNVENTAGKVIGAVVLSGLTYFGYRYFWNKKVDTEEKQMLIRGVIVLVGCAAAYKWFKVLFSN
jgi:hypothetical protein